MWRDRKEVASPFTCGTPPAMPAAEDLYVFNEQEDAQSLNAVQPFSAEAERLQVGGGALAVPYPFGWLYMNLNADVGNGNPTTDPAAAQGWVAAVFDALGRFSVGLRAMELDNAIDTSHECIATGVPPAPDCP